MKDKNGLYVKVSLFLLVLMLVGYFGYSFSRGTYSYQERTKFSCDKYNNGTYEYYINSNNVCEREASTTNTCPDGGRFHPVGSNLCLANTDSSAICLDGYSKVTDGVLGDDSVRYYCSAKSSLGYYCADGESVRLEKYCTIGMAEEYKVYILTLTYDGNKGTTNESIKTCDVETLGDKCSITLGSATLAGNNFLGWDTSKECKNPTTGEYFISNDTTLYACWDPNVYTVSYDSNGGIGSMSSQKCTYGEVCTLKANTFTKTGYTFGGWTTSADSTNLNYVDRAPFTYKRTEDLQLYAIWETEEDDDETETAYTITYNVNGGTGSMSSQKCTYGSSCTLKANTFTKENSTFKGWATSPGSTTVAYTDKKVFTYSLTSNLTLYAVWEDTDGDITEPTYSVTIYGNGGTPSSQQFSCTSTTGKCVLDISNYVAPTRKNYNLIGFAIDKDSCNTQYKFTVAQFEQALKVDSSGNLSYYSCWLENETEEDTITYTVTYDANGGSGAPIVQTKNKGTSLKLSSTKPTRSGYTFKNWNTTANGTGTSYASSANYTTDSDVKLYAQWSANEYTITYNVNGGTGSMSSQKCTYGTSCTLKANTFTKENSTFKGWATSPGSTTVAYTDKKGFTYSLTSNLTLYAVWEKVDDTFIPETFRAMFNANGGTLSGDSSKTCSTTSNSSTCNIVGLPSATKNGYTFTGWGLSSTCSSGENSKFTLDKNNTYYACYTKNVSTPGADEDGNVTDNKQTGEIAISLMWFIGLMAIGYSFYYFKNIKQN